MKITTAKTAGFCFGVKRAVDLTYNLAKEDKKVATLGELIHNKQLVADLEKKGVITLDSTDIPQGYEVVIRSHGIVKSIYDELEAKGVTTHDATCPYVKKIHNIAEKISQDGKILLVMGDENHPEVQATAPQKALFLQVLKTLKIGLNSAKTAKKIWLWWHRPHICLKNGRKA